MISLPRKRTAAGLAALALLTLTAACEGDTALGPIDGARCVAGQLRADAAPSGRLDAASCQLWSSYMYNVVPTATWTLEADANTAHIVRLIPTDTGAGATPLRASLVAYARDGRNEVQLLGGDAFSFGTAQRNREIALTATEPTTFALRVEAWSPTDSGNYRLELSSCPLRRLPLDSTVTGIGSNTGCTARGMHGGARSRVSFLTFDVDELGEYAVGFRRSAGTGSVTGRLAGYGAAVSQTREADFLRSQPNVTTNYVFTRNLTRLGRATLLLSVHADSGATVEAYAGRGVPTIVATPH